MLEDIIRKCYKIVENCKIVRNSVSALAPTGTRSIGHFTVSATATLFNFQGADRILPTSFSLGVIY